jgi:hypothetical protein
VHAEASRALAGDRHSRLVRVLIDVGRIGRACQQRERAPALIATQVPRPDGDLAQRVGQLAAGPHAAAGAQVLGLLHGLLRMALRCGGGAR